MAVSPEIFLQNLCFTNKPSVLLRSHGTLQGLMEPASASGAGDSWSPRIARECAHRNEQISLPSHCTKCPSQCLSAELKSHFKVCLLPRCYSGITLRGASSSLPLYWRQHRWWMLYWGLPQQTVCSGKGQAEIRSNPKGPGWTRAMEEMGILALCPGEGSYRGANRGSRLGTRGLPWWSSG